MNAPGRATRHAWVLLGFYLAPLGLLGCATDEIVTATLSSSDHACASNADCLPTAYCAKVSCADTSGSCRLRPLLCDNTSASRCGCDGVTYWNDCLRMQNGVVAATNGECAAEAATCASADATDCPVAGASCAQLLPGGPNCPASAIGACWALPPDCPAQMGPQQRWAACDGSVACEDTCSAIRSGVPHRRAFGNNCY